MENRNSIKSKIQAGIGNSWPIGTFFQIPVKVHWTFGLLLIFVIYTIVNYDLKLWQSVALMAVFLFVFVCVILHEYGHALMARKYGIKTSDIILSPIGGVARLDKLAERPKEELLITAAGPAVNLVIATILGLGFLIVDGRFPFDINEFDIDKPADFVKLLVPINLGLFVFNLIPAFPMDGGRILRALLAMKIGKLKATRIAAGIGRVLAIGFVIFGIFDQQLSLSLIGLFIFMMAGKEYDQTKVISLLGTTTVGDIMRTAFTRLHLSDLYSTVIEKYHAGEHNFLVFDSMGNMSGTIPELFIKDTIKSQSHDKSVNQMMSNKMASVKPELKLKEVIDLMREQGIAIVSITDEKDLIVGVLDRNDIESHLRSKVE